MSAYGIDFEGPLPSARYNVETWQDVSVEVPEIICPISEAQLHNLSSTINPLKDIGDKKFYSLYLLYLPMEYLITHFRESIAFSC